MQKRCLFALTFTIVSTVCTPVLAAQGSQLTDFPSATDVNGTFCNAIIPTYSFTGYGDDEVVATEDFLSTDYSKFLIIGYRYQAPLNAGGTASTMFFYDWTGSDGNEHYSTLPTPAYGGSASPYMGTQISFEYLRNTNPGVSPATWTATVWRNDGNTSNSSITTNETYITKSICYVKNISQCYGKLRGDFWYYLGHNDAGNWWYVWNSSSNNQNDSCPLYGHSVGSIANNSSASVWIATN